MFEVVIDTNVLIAAFRSSLGASWRLLQTLEERQWRPVISPALALEYEAVLKRDTGVSSPSFTDIDEFIEYFCSRARLVQIYFRWRPVCRGNVRSSYKSKVESSCLEEMSQ